MASTRGLRKAKEDLVRESQAIIKGPDTAKKWLFENELVLKGENLSMMTMTMALQQLSSGRFLQPRDMIHGMRAIAMCMEEIIQTRHTSEALDTITEQVEDIVKGAKAAVEDLVEGVKTAMKEAEARVLKRSETGGRDEVERIIEKAVQTATKPSYAQALASGKSSQTETKDLQIRMDTEARGQLQRKQIILDGDDSTRENTSKLTPKEIISKVNLALDKLEKDMAETLEDDNNDRPENAKFVAARVLKNGGVLLEMSDENGAEWLKQKEIARAFERYFPGTVAIKGKTYQVVVQFLSTGLCNRLEKLLTAIEDENHLTPGSIDSVKWLRNPDNWSPNQTKAHAILTLNSRYAANDLIKNGILIDGTRHEAKKLEEDPRRCFKCQLMGVGHTAATCKAEEACSKCAKNHLMRGCKATRAEYQCATCRKNGGRDNHAAWDRQCPVFIKERAWLRDKKPENQYRFFPVEHHDWTWVRHEDSPADGYACNGG